MCSAWKVATLTVGLREVCTLANSIRKKEKGRRKEEDWSRAYSAKCPWTDITHVNC